MGECQHDLRNRVLTNGEKIKRSWLMNCWKTISGDYLMKLIERMPKVCKAVIKAKGGYFEESKICVFWVISHFFVYYIIQYV